MAVPRPRLRLALLASIAAIVLAGCGSAASHTSGQPAARSIAAFDGTTLDVPVAGKPTAVYFFATDCGSCVPR